METSLLHIEKNDSKKKIASSIGKQQQQAFHVDSCDFLRTDITDFMKTWNGKQTQWNETSEELVFVCDHYILIHRW